MCGDFAGEGKWQGLTPSSVSQSRVSDLVRGKWQQFSLDMLVTLAVRAGRRVNMELLAA